MVSIHVLDLKGQKTEELQLLDSVFNVEPNMDLLYRYVDMQLNNRRQGTANTKTRSEVTGTGKKPYPQKNTGRSRQGSLKGPHQRHGGVAFGPKPRDWSTKLNKKMKQLALKSALSVRFKEGNILVLDDLKMDQPKTKGLLQILTALGVNERKALIILPYKKEEYMRVRLSGKNLPKVKVIIADNPGVGDDEVRIDGVNVYDIINNETLILTKATVSKIQEVLGNG